LTARVRQFGWKNRSSRGKSSQTFPKVLLFAFFSLVLSLGGKITGRGSTQWLKLKQLRRSAANRNEVMELAQHAQLGGLSNKK